MLVIMARVEELDILTFVSMVAEDNHIVAIQRTLTFAVISGLFVI